MQKRILTSFFSLSLSYIFNVKWVDIIKLTESYFMHIVTTCSFACMNPIKRLNRSGNRCACGFLHSKYLMQIWGFFRCHPISLQSVFHVLSMCVNWKNYALWSLIVSIINIQFYFAVWNEALDNSQVSHVSIICLKTRVLKDWMLEFRKFQTIFISSIEPKVWIYDEVNRSDYLYLVDFLIFNFEKWKYDEGNCMWESRKNIAMCLGNKRLWMSTADMKRSEIRKKEWKKRKNEWKERKLQRATRVYWTSTHRVLYAVCIKMKCRSMCGVRYEYVYALFSWIASHSMLQSVYACECKCTM